MGADGVNQLPVMSDGQVEGMLSREDVLNYLRKLKQLGM
jgi:signal-transduction protein with cAMP-binding, CBS, and nucleotidyltransferase domain